MIKKLTSLIFISLCIVSLTLSGCKKDEVAERTETLTANSKKLWKLIERNNNSQLAACVVDDRWEFKTGGVVTIDAAQIKCGNEPDIQTGGWVWQADETKFKFSGLDDDSTWDVVQLTNEIFEIKSGSKQMKFQKI